MTEDSKTQHEELEMQSSSQLERALREELDKKAPDREKVLCILEILEHRENEKPISSAKKTVKGKSGYRRLNGIVAAALVILILALVTPPVFGAENIVELVGRWTKDLFALLYPECQRNVEIPYVFTTSNPALQDIHDAAVENGITQRIVPTWIPEGCEIDNLEVTSTSGGTKITAYLTENSNFTILSFEPVNVASANNYPKNAEDAFIREIAGNKHYVFLNNDTCTVVWVSSDMVCCMTTNYSEETVYHIVNSIYMGEN